MLFSSSFNISVFISRSLVHFCFASVQHSYTDLVSIFCSQIINYPSTVTFGPFVKNQMDEGCLHVLYSMLLIYVSIFCTKPCYFVAIVCIIEAQNCDAPHFLLLGIVLAIMGIFWFHINFRILFFSVFNNGNSN